MSTEPFRTQTENAHYYAELAALCAARPNGCSYREFQSLKIEAALATRRRFADTSSDCMPAAGAAA